MSSDATAAESVEAWSNMSERSGMRLIGHSGLSGWGDGMQVLKWQQYVYVAHTGYSSGALTILDCADPRRPKIVNRFEHPPNTRSHKVQIADGLLLQNCEFPYFGDRSRSGVTVRGLRVYDLSDPVLPRLVGFYASGGRGVHRLWYDGGALAHIAANRVSESDSRAYHLVSISKPDRPELVGEWSLPGTNSAAAQERWPVCSARPRYEVHGVIPCGDRAYVACEDAGMAILDISDPRAPSVLGHVGWPPGSGGMVHTCLPIPGTGIVVATEEQLDQSSEQGVQDKRIWTLESRDPANPTILAPFPIPRSSANASLGPFQSRGVRFGPHNVHENRPGSFRSERYVFATYFSAGIRVFDIGDASNPQEVAHFVPARHSDDPICQLNDLYVDTNGLVYATDRRTGGLYIIESTFLTG